jgi:hypothetical protein
MLAASSLIVARISDPAVPAVVGIHLTCNVTNHIPSKDPAMLKFHPEASLFTNPSVSISTVGVNVFGGLNTSVKVPFATVAVPVLTEMIAPLNARFPIRLL